MRFEIPVRGNVGSGVRTVLKLFDAVFYLYAYQYRRRENARVCWPGQSHSYAGQAWHEFWRHELILWHVLYVTCGSLPNFELGRMIGLASLHHQAYSILKIDVPADFRICAHCKL